MDISHAMESLNSDFEAADQLVDNIYTKYFARYFKRSEEFEKAFRNKEVAVTDVQLEDIMVGLPLDLMQASSSLSQFKHHHEIVKLTIKQRKKQNKGEVPMVDDDLDSEYALMSIVYSSVILRVETQITFAKELIMSSKKVWDARRRSENSNPIKEYVELPDYTPDNSDIGGQNNGTIF